MNTLINDWHSVYCEYLGYDFPDATPDEINEMWSEYTAGLIEYYHDTPEIWGGNFVKFLKCYTDWYGRINEHRVYIGYQPNMKMPGSLGRYLP